MSRLAIEVVGHAVRSADIDAGARILVEHPDQSVGLRERQRLQQHAVDHRKDRDIGRQAQRQRGDRGEGETAIFPEQPYGKTQILQQSVHGYVSLRWQQNGKFRDL